MSDVHFIFYSLQLSFYLVIDFNIFKWVNFHPPSKLYIPNIQEAKEDC